LMGGRCVVPGSLTVARTEWPAASSARMRCAAMKPVPPVTQYSGISRASVVLGDLSHTFSVGAYNI
jgi:hypothetical protein